MMTDFSFTLPSPTHRVGVEGIKHDCRRLNTHTTQIWGVIHTAFMAEIRERFLFPVNASLNTYPTKIRQALEKGNEFLSGKIPSLTGWEFPSTTVGTGD